MNEILIALGEAVRSRREHQKLTKPQLASASGVSLRFINDVEQGRANPSVLKLHALAVALGSSIASFLTSHGKPSKPTRISLLGIRGAGKTTIGRRLAAKLSLAFVELDRRIEEKASLSLAEIFALHGEDYYRRLEKTILDEVLADAQPCVIATGGGIVSSAETFALLKAHTVTVWLRASAEEHWNRVVQQGDRRPMKGNPQAMAELRRLLASRRPLYATARHIVETSARTPDEVSGRIAALVVTE